MNTNMNTQRNRKNKSRKTMSLSQLEKLPWVKAVADIPVGCAIQYRDLDTGEVVYWHIRQPSIQKTMKMNQDGTTSKVRQGFFDKVNLNRLFLTYTP